MLMKQPDNPFAITRYLNIQAAYGPSFNASGTRVAFLSTITGVPQVWSVPVLGAEDPIPWPEQLTFEAERVSFVQYSPTPGDERLIYARDTGGNEKAQLFLLDPVTGAEVALTAGYEQAMHLPGSWSPDGTQFLFAANRRHPALFDLFVLPLDGEARLVWENDVPGYLVDMSFSPDQQRALVRRMVSSFEHALFEVDLRTGQARQLTDPPEPARTINPCYSADGRAVFALTDEGSEYLRLARLDLESLAWETLVAPAWNVEGLARSADGRLLVYEVNAGGVSELYAYNVETGESRRAPVPDDVPGIVQKLTGFEVSIAPDGSQVVFTWLPSTRTADIALWDLATDRVRRVTRSAHGGLPLNSFVAPELVRYPTFDEDETGQPRMIPAWLYRPPAASGDPLPVVVVVHGGPEGQSRAGFLFYVQYFVRQGYAVLLPNVRGSVGYGKTYSHLDDVEKRMDSVADLAHAAYWLKEQPFIDGERIAVYGGSYGGFMVLAALTHYPDLWAAGVDIVGISNLATFLENTSDYRRAHREAEYGSLARDRDFLERIAPINHVDKITAPLMVIHGANDPRVPLSEAEQMVAALRERDIPVEFLVFDDEGHGIVKLKNKLVAFPAIVDFLDRYVKNA